MSDNTGIYVVLAFYVVATSVVTFCANKNNREEAGTTGDEVTTHFLAGKNFGAVVLYLTTFASCFSGYTVVGVPNDSYKQGYNGIRWFSMSLALGISMIALYPRLRRLSTVRKYMSPGDFIMDRFNSNRLKLMAVFSMCVPQLMYIAVQFHALGNLISQLTAGAISFWLVAPVSAVMCLVYEYFGGMRSVAYTDAVEGAVMIAVFIIIPCAIAVKHGAFAGQVAYQDQKCVNSKKLGNLTYGCINYVERETVKSFFTRTPSHLNNINMLIFSISMLSYSLNPFMIQRLFSGRTVGDIKTVTKTIFLNNYLAQTGGVLLGLTVLANKVGYQEEYQNNKGFFMFLNQWLYEGRVNGDIGQSLLMYILILAAIAGVMSTADSSLLGTSNTFTVDIFKNWLKPNASSEQIVNYGRIVSVVTVALSLALALFMEATKDPVDGVSYNVLATLQGGIAWQILPAFYFGMYTDIKERVVFGGCVVGLSVFLILAVYNVVIAGNSDDIYPIWNAVHEDAVKLSAGFNALVGAMMNLAYCTIVHLQFSGANDQDELITTTEYGPRLTHARIVDYMQKKFEPIFYKGGWAVAAMGFLLIAQVFPRIGIIDPDIKDVPGYAVLDYNGKPNEIIAGLPSWAFWQLMLMVIGCIIGVVTVDSWDTSYDDSVKSGDVTVELSEPRNRNSWAM